MSPRVYGRTASSPLDRLGIGLAGLCLVHCLASALLLGLFAAAGGVLGSHLVHEAGLMLAMPLAALALVRGALRHGEWLPSSAGGLGIGIMAGALNLHHEVTAGGTDWLTVTAWTLAGVGLLALGHDLNRRALA